MKSARLDVSFAKVTSIVAAVIAKTFLEMHKVSEVKINDSWCKW
jgi:hypothetical protein